MMLEEGDLLVLPAGIYHRFTTNEDNVRGHTLLDAASSFILPSWMGIE